MSKQFPRGSDRDTETEAIESTELKAHTRGECPGYPRCLTCVMENEEKIATSDGLAVGQQERFDGLLLRSYRYLHTLSSGMRSTFRAAAGASTSNISTL
jgi:hypothetical protein